MPTQKPKPDIVVPKKEAAAKPNPTAGVSASSGTVTGVSNSSGTASGYQPGPTVSDADGQGKPGNAYHQAEQAAAGASIDGASKD
jgi:hypothetical protein